MVFDFKDLTYNAAAAPETTKTKAGDPIRDSSYDYLYSAVTMAYAKNRLPGLYPGIIVSAREANNMSAIAANKAVVPGIPTSAVEGELVGWEGFDDTFESLNIYKVVNIILNPLPYPISYRDPILLHYPDFDAVNATQTLPIGMLVQLDYHSDDHLKGGRIVQEGPVIDLGWGDISMMSLQDIWSQNEPKPIPSALTPYTGDTSNTDSLIEFINSKDRLHNTGAPALSSGGDLTPEIVAAAKQIAETLLGALSDGVIITFTSGNDLFHQGLKCFESTGKRINRSGGRCYTSVHTTGNGLDFKITPASPADQIKVQNILYQYVEGNAGRFRFINEYSATGTRSGAATGDHFHISMGAPGRSEESLSLTEAKQMAAADSEFVSIALS